MNQKKLSNWLKAVCILIGVCGLIVYALILPGRSEEHTSELQSHA